MSGNISIFTDGGARGNPGPSACAFVVISNNSIIDCGAKFLQKSTNNFAEYNAVLLAYEWLSKNVEVYKISSVNFFLDSELVVRQLTGIYKIKNITLRQLSLQIKEFEKILRLPINYQHIPREKNKNADFLVNKILDENEANFMCKFSGKELLEELKKFVEN
jgi:ribonuclease HI